MSTLHADHYREMLRRLRQARQDAGLNQSEVAAILGRPQSFVSKLETGERHIDPVELQRLAELYGREVQEFLVKRTLADPDRLPHEQPEEFADVMRSVGPRTAKGRT